MLTKRWEKYYPKVEIEDVKSLPFRDLWEKADEETKKEAKDIVIEKLKEVDWDKEDFFDLSETLEYHMKEDYQEVQKKIADLLAENVYRRINSEETV